MNAHYGPARWTMTLFSMLGLGACEERPTPAPIEIASTPTVAPALPSTKASAAPSDKPRTKEHAAPEAARLGQLPEGIGIEVGKSAPKVDAKNAEGETVELEQLWQEGPVLLVFYRGGWCPYCNFQIRELTKAFPEFQKRGVTPVAISVDQPSKARATKASYEIPFPVLSDSALKVHEQFSVAFEADDEMVAKLKERGHDLEAYSGRDHHAYAIPSIFLIDEAGKVRWAHADLDYKVRPTVPQLLDVIQRTLSSSEH